MKLDDLFAEIGDFGPYQKKIYFFASLPTILMAAETLSVIFIFFIPKHRCKIPGLENDTYFAHTDSYATLRNLTIPFIDDEWDSCNIYGDVNATTDVGGTDEQGNSVLLVNRSREQCSDWVFDTSIFQSTIATEFNVVCDRSILRAQSTITSELGTFLGIFVCGVLSDRYGRKLIFFLSALALFGGGVGIAFCSSLVTINICRFVLGSARQGTFLNGLVLGMETVGATRRILTGIIINFFWAFGAFYLCLFAYFIRNWRYLEIAVSVPGILVFLLWWPIPESPRWLMSKGRWNNAMAIFRKIADSNKTQMPAIDDVSELLEQEIQLSIKHVFGSRELMKRLLIVASNTFINAVVYYGLTLNITNLSGDIFVNYTINFALETVAYAVCIIALQRIGRKPVYLACILTGGICCTVCIVPVLLNAPSWILTALSMTGRFCIIISYTVMYLYGAELFPTVIRVSAMGTCISLSRIANFMSPLLADLGLLVGGRFRDALPLVIMGSPAIVVGILPLWLPETRNCALTETLKDLENTPRNRKGKREKPDADPAMPMTDTTQTEQKPEINHEAVTC